MQRLAAKSPVSLAACRDCRQRKVLCPAGSISCGSIPANVGWQHTVSPWHRAGSALRPSGSGGCLVSVLEGPLLPCVSSALGDGWGWKRVACPQFSPSSAPQGGNPPSVALMETPFCVASWLCTYLVSLSARMSVLAQDGISPLKMLSPVVKPPGDSHSARLPAWDPGCQESAVILQPNPAVHPACTPVVRPV